MIKIRFAPYYHPFQGTCTETVYQEGDAYFNALLASINLAEKSILLEVYIFDIDEIGNKILDHLVTAAKRGVQVKLLLDGFGSAHWNAPMATIYRQQGINIQFFNPLPWQRNPQKIWHYINVKKFFSGFYKFQRRNHRKTCLIDEKIFFIGSRNITQNHSPLVMKNLAWRDTCVSWSFEQPHPEALKKHLQQFYLTWNLLKQDFFYRWHQIITDKKREHSALMESIHLAQSKVWITNPYFLPNYKFLRALANAARRGIDVRLLVPQKINVFFFKFAVEAIYGFLLNHGVKVYEYLPSMLHAKICIIDDETLIGSYNLDFRSIYFNLEINLPLIQSTNKKIIAEQFLIDLSQSQKIELASWNKRFWLNKLLEKIILRFRAIM